METTTNGYGGYGFGYSAGSPSSVTAQTLQPVFVVLSYGLHQAEKGFNALPGSAVILR
ncbi:hypothetical protein FRC17_003211, partial [Serendipita sp. 399]